MKKLGTVTYFARCVRLPARVGVLLRRKGLTLSTAESCTGGLVGSLITDVPGSSDYYLGGVVAYSDKAKLRMLGVKAATLRQQGAVSAQTVKEMAHGVRVRLRADVGIAVSGVAGPGGATKKKPVGLVYVGLEIGDCPYFQRYRFRGNRRSVKEQAARAALELIIHVLENDQ